MFPTSKSVRRAGKSGLEDRDYTIGQAMGDLFLDFVGDIFAGALDNLLFKKR